MLPRPKKVSTLKNLILKIIYPNGEIRYFDIKPYLDFGIFSELQKEQYFKQATISGNTVSWPHGQDIDPDTLYLESKKVKG